MRVSFILTLAVAGCGAPSDGEIDSGRLDASTHDAGPIDARVATDALVPVDAGPFDAGPPPPCPLDLEARALLEEIVVEGLLDGVWLAIESHDPPSARHAFALTLPGTTYGWLGSYSPIGECAPGTFLDTSCNDLEPGEPVDPFYETRIACGRRGWTAECADVQQVWFATLPQREPEPRHAFSYPLDLPPASPISGLAGEVRWAENPFVSYERTRREDGALVIFASIDHALSLVLADRSIDLSHSGSIEAITSDGHPVSVVFAAAFSGIGGERVISASAEITNPDGRVEGNVVVDGFEVLGTVTGTLPETPAITWIGGCAP